VGRIHIRREDANGLNKQSQEANKGLYSVDGDEYMSRAVTKEPVLKNTFAAKRIEITKNGNN
jgi:hypothetical protein